MRLDRAALTGKAQTVAGLIEPGAIGRTLMHEHVLCDITPPKLAARNDPGPEITLENVWAINYGQIQSARKYRLDLLDVAISEIDLMRRAGGRTIVELSCGGLKPDPRGLLRIAEATGVHVVMGCGHYVDEYQDAGNRERTVDDFAAEIIDQVQVGAWGTEIRAGMIGEIGCQAPWTDLEKRVMRAAILAQAETGAAINVHPGRHHDQPQEAAEFIVKNGGDTSRVVISHIDRTIFDLDRMLRLADTGCTLEFDLFGIEQSYYASSDIDMPNDAMRLRHIRGLIDHGHLDRVVISHDICYRTRLTRFGGHGYGHIFANVVPMMGRRGFTETEVDAILVENPRRLLTFA
ncbi:MAG: aryldialkylphosphatase [Alphaproteobacteria bacterium]|nr:aryldialkylphosphatase [Alphaproteobacteria bacterium]